MHIKIYHFLISGLCLINQVRAYEKFTFRGIEIDRPAHNLGDLGVVTALTDSLDFIKISNRFVFRQLMKRVKYYDLITVTAACKSKVKNVVTEEAYDLLDERLSEIFEVKKNKLRVASLYIDQPEPKEPENYCSLFIGFHYSIDRSHDTLKRSINEFQSEKVRKTTESDSFAIQKLSPHLEHLNRCEMIFRNSP